MSGRVGEQESGRAGEWEREIMRLWDLSLSRPVLRPLGHSDELSENMLT